MYNMIYNGIEFDNWDLDEVRARGIAEVKICPYHMVRYEKELKKHKASFPMIIETGYCCVKGCDSFRKDREEGFQFVDIDINKVRFEEA